jgi:membrane associated rhomboid family serine protease
MTPGVRSLIVANVAMYVLATSSPGVFQALMLVPIVLAQRPWTLVTYMFLHAGFFHLGFNMLALYFFGPGVETRLGTERFFVLYFVSGVVGALASFIMTPTAAIVGASAAVFGVMLAYATYWPTDLILVWGIVPIQARWFVIGMTALSLVSGLGGMQSGTAHFAHLGGFLGGWLYLKWLERYSPAARFRAAANAPRFRSEGMATALERWRKIPLDQLHPVNREEVERLLRKGEEGLGLTPQERAVLDRFSPG